MADEAVSLRSRIGKVEVDGFVGNAPGPHKDGASWLGLARSSMAFVWAGSLCRVARPGNEGEVLWDQEIPWRALNSLGLPCLSPEQYIEPLERVEELGKHLVVDVAGFEVDDFPWLGLFFWRPGRSLCLNLTCPNSVGHGIFAFDEGASREAIAKTRDAVPDANLVVTLNAHPDPKYRERMARILQDESVDAIRLCNTWPDAMVRDRDSLRPFIDPNEGLAGLSGECIRPMVEGQIVRWRQLLPEIGIIAAGGINKGWHVVHYLADGADACVSATEYYRSRVGGLQRIQTEMIEEMRRLGVYSLSDIRRWARKEN